LSYTTDQYSIQNASSAGAGSSGYSRVFSGVFIDEKFDGIGHKQSAYNTTVDTNTLVSLYLNMCLRSACFNDEASYW
jgi:hypothetical protein